MRIEIAFDGHPGWIRTEEAIDLTVGIGGTGGHFALGSVAIEPLSRPTSSLAQGEQGFACDRITFCPHAHCTHSEGAAHVRSSSRAGRSIPKVPLFQLCAYGCQHPDASAELDADLPARDTRHWLTSRCSVDPISDGGRLERHRGFFRDHPDGLITELVRRPDRALRPGLYVLQATILPICGQGTDAHPTSVVLYPFHALDAMD